MPTAPGRACMGVGPRRGACRNAVLRGSRYCRECEPYHQAKIREYDALRDKGDQRKFLHSTTWRSLREMKLRQDPLCERHVALGRPVSATLVHHRDGNELNNAAENLESLCATCHEEHETKVGKRGWKR